MEATHQPGDTPNGGPSELRDPGVSPDPVPPTDLGDFFLKAPVLTCRATPDGYLA